MFKIAMFINHEIGGAVVAFYGFMKVFRRNGYRIDLYRFNRAGESFLPLSELADQEINYDLQFRQRVKLRLPLLREYVNTYRYWRNLKDLEESARKMALEMNSRDY